MTEAESPAKEFVVTFRRAALAAALLLLGIGDHAFGQVKLARESTIDFATPDQGRAVLTQRDDFVERMSPFDRAARVQTDREVSEAEYLKFAGANVLEWNAEERQKICTALQAIQARLVSFNLPFPGAVLLVKTTGKEEGGAAYTLANSIMLPPAILSGAAGDLPQIIAHELFHVLSRANPVLREKLYSAIGFIACEEVALPPDLRARKITNPDAPKNNHCIKVSAGGEESWAIPIIYSSSEKYDVRRGGPFFNYLQFQMLLVDRGENSSTPSVKVHLKHGKAALVGVDQVTGFYEQVGRNTGYIIHPEEILADNFALLVLDKRDVPTPAVLEKIEAILKSSDR